jgi:hypothetical protein
VLLLYSTSHALLEDGVWKCGEVTGGVKAAGIDLPHRFVASLRHILSFNSPYTYAAPQTQTKQITVEVGCGGNVPVERGNLKTRW